VALALNIVIDDTSAELARNFTGADDVTITSTSLNATRAETKASAKGASSTEDGSKDGKESRDSEQETNAQSSYATSRSGTTKAPASDAQSGGLSEANSKSSGESGQSASEGGGTSVAASVAVNFLETHNTASVAPGVSINATGALDVAAVAAVDAAAVGLATATNTDADTGVAAAVGLNIALAGNSASVGNGAQLTAGSIAVRAGTPDVDSKNPAYRNTFQARALAGAASSDTAVGGSISLNYLDLDTNATVGSNAGLHATAGKLEVSAVSHNEIQNIAGGAALSTEGGTGVGVAVAVNIVNGLDTNASIGNNTTATASGDASITATASLVPVVETLPVLGEIGLTSFAAGIAGSAGGTAVGGSGSVNVYLMDTHASVDDNASVTAGGSVTIEATDILHVFSAAGGLAATTGGSGVGIGIDVGVIERNTTAWVGSGADLTAGDDIVVHADSDDDVKSIAASFGLSGGNVGVAGSIAVQVLTTQTRAYVEDADPAMGGNLTAGGDVSITANGDLNALMIAGALGASTSAGVGVANTTLVHNDTVEARLGNRASSMPPASTASTSARPRPRIHFHHRRRRRSELGRRVGIAHDPDPGRDHARLRRPRRHGECAERPRGRRARPVGRCDRRHHDRVDRGLDRGAGSVGVGVGADVLYLQKDTQAYMDSGVTAHVDGDIDVSARSSEDITSVAAGISIGGTAGIGINASVHVLDLSTRAFIGDDPDEAAGSAGAGDVHALGTVRIAADDETEMDKFVATVAVGGSAGVGAAATVSVIDKKTEAFIGQGASVTGDGKTAGLAAANGMFESKFVSSSAGTTGLEAGDATDQSASELSAAGEVGAPT
jgi:hypothetical protein